MNRWLSLAITLIASAIIGFFAAQPPAVLPADSAAAGFSAARAMTDIRMVAQRPHPTGSPDNARVRLYLAARLRALGFEVREASAPLSEKGRARLRKWGDPDAATRQVVNLVAVRRGSDPAVALVAVMAHYDSVWGSPGAADDGAGVGAALEIARALAHDKDPMRGLAVILTDGEELGLEGAAAFFAQDPLANRIGVLINMETRGGGGRAAMFETGPDNGAMIDLFRRHVTRPSANSMSVKIYELLPNSTDFTHAKKRGIPGFNFAFIGRAELYHSPRATPDALDARSVQDMGAQALEITRALLRAPSLPPHAPDAVFGDVLGAGIIAYPPVVGWVLLALVAALLGVGARRKRREIRLGGVDGGILAGLAMAVTAAALLYGGNLLSGADAPMNYYDRLAALPRLEVQALLLMGAALAAAVALAGQRAALWGGWLGLAVLGLLLAGAVQALLPAAAPLLAWPLLLAALAFAGAAHTGRTGTGLAIIAAVLGLAQTGIIAHFVLLGIGISIPTAIAALAPLVLLLLWPVLPRLPRRPALLAMLALVLTAGVLALWVRLDPLADSVPPYSDTK